MDPPPLAMIRTCLHYNDVSHKLILASKHGDGRSRLASRLVVLVDDVITTGATLFTAAKCLSAARSGPVSSLVIARVARPREP